MVRTTSSNHLSSTWCGKIFESIGEATPPCGVPSVAKCRFPASRTGLEVCLIILRCHAVNACCPILAGSYVGFSHPMWLIYVIAWRSGGITGGTLAETTGYVSTAADRSPTIIPRTQLDFVPRLFLAGRMARDDEPIRPMTLGSMRQPGVRGLFVTCQHCGHERAVNMDDWPDGATVPSFGPRMRCSRM
jgi:hypothetical protein